MKCQLSMLIILFLGCINTKAFREPVDAALLDTLTAIGTKEMKTSYITFATSLNDQKYVIKQCKIEPHFFRPVKTIMEMVALEIGYSLNVPLNDSWLIPVGTPCIGKELAAPASLHTYLPGMPFDEWYMLNLNTSNKYLHVKIKQKEPLGLTYQIIKHMWKHKNLSCLAGYDTFVGNVDRGMANLFYEPKEDVFYGIDMGSAFSSLTCQASLENMQKLFEVEKRLLSYDEMRGLKRYYKILKKLVKKYPPQVIHHKIDTLCLMANLNALNFLLNPEVVKNCENYIKRCKNICTDNYFWARHLCAYLKKVIHA